MKKLILLVSLTMFFVLFTVPVSAQETVSPEDSSENVVDQYGPDARQASEVVAKRAVEDIIGKEGPGRIDGAEAYAAALKAARDTGVDEETAEAVAAEAVSEVSEKSVTAEGPEITELPDTGGLPYAALAGGFIVGAGLLVRRVSR